MLETNQKFRTIIVERRTKAGKWVFHSKVIRENPFTEEASLECMKDNSAILILGLLL